MAPAPGLSSDEPTTNRTPDRELSPSSSPPQELPEPEPTILKAGPFAGLPLPHASARANAAHIVRTHVSTYLITHPHLDHLSGFVINTAGFHATTRPKILAALPFTVEAIKTHIFNDVIWPNLTDEEGGVGFVTFQRLKEGGDVMVGEGEGSGYIEVCEGLGVKGFKISHGKCVHAAASGMSTTPHRPSLGNALEQAAGPGYAGHRESVDARSLSIGHAQYVAGGNGGHETPGKGPQAPGNYFGNASPQWDQPPVSVVDSTAYFIRTTGAPAREVLILGDVEPDSISFAPRLANVWAEAAPKIAAGVLRGLFIECSYDNSQGDAVLFGHLAPRHLVYEMSVLAGMVREENLSRQEEKARRKRKRSSRNGSGSGSGNLGDEDRKRSRSLAMEASRRRSSVPDAADTVMADDVHLRHGAEVHAHFRHSHNHHHTHHAHTGPSTPHHTHSHTHQHSPGLVSPTSVGFPPSVTNTPPPLKGLRVVVIHVKDTLKDGPHVSERILEQLRGHAEVLGARGEELGCEFSVSESGGQYWF